MLDLLLENKDIDLSTLKKETGFMKTIDEIKKILEDFYDCEQYKESQENNDE
jgi:hypothetical protein